MLDDLKIRNKLALLVAGRDARGPVGVEQLTTFKYRVHGSGQVRP